MPRDPRSLQLHRAKRHRRTRAPELLEERRLLTGGRGSIFVESFSDNNGDGVYQADPDSLHAYPNASVYQDDGDGVLDTEVDAKIDRPSEDDRYDRLTGKKFYGDRYANLPYGRYFVVKNNPTSQTRVLTTPPIQVVDLTSESPSGIVSFGWWSTGTATFSVFNDTNANGVRDANEPLRPGTTTINVGWVEGGTPWTLDLTDGVTDRLWERGTGGRIYSIGKQREDGLVATTADPVQVNYEPMTHSTVEFGVVPGATIRAVVFSDQTGDGRTSDDRTEALSRMDASIKITGQTLDGRSIELVAEYRERTYYEYVAENLLPGSYRAELVVEGDRFTLHSKEPLVRDFDVGIGETIHIDFAAFFSRSIEEAIDTSRIAGSKELSFAGIAVELFRDNGDGVFDPKSDTLLAADISDSAANYKLPGFGPGSYILAARVGEEFTPAEIAAAKIYQAQSIFSPEQVLIPSASVGGQVFVDPNGNGLLEPRERTLSQVEMTLEGTDVFGNQVSRVTSTDYQGKYEFSELQPGTYSLIQEQPLGYSSGTQSIGGFGGVSSTNRVDNIAVEIGQHVSDYLFIEHGSLGLRDSRPGYRDDIGVYEPTASSTYLSSTHRTGTSWAAFHYGLSGSKAIAGDWNNSGYDGVGYYDAASGLFSLKNTNRSIADDDLATFLFGGKGFVPIAGDWNWDGVETVGVFDSTTASFYLRNSNDSGVADAAQFTFGRPGWIPIAGDWDGDGYAGVGVYDPATATFYLKNSLSAGSPDIAPFNYGMPNMTPLSGDWDDNYIDSIGIYDPTSATFFLRNSNSSGIADIEPFTFGMPGWQPIVGDWNSSGAAYSNLPFHRGVIISSPGIPEPPPFDLVFGGNYIDEYLKGDSAGLKEAIAAEAASAVLAEETASVIDELELLTESTAPAGSISISNLTYVAPEIEPEDESGELLDLLAADQLSG